MKNYESIEVVTKEQALAILDNISNISRDEIVQLLLGLYEIEDKQWVQDLYLKFIINDDFWVSSAAITGLGHLARVNGLPDKSKVVCALNNLCREKSELELKIVDAISDIDTFSE